MRIPDWAQRRGGEAGMAGGEADTEPQTTPEAPTAEETPTAEESVATKEEVITEALVNVLGKNFIIKESKDFFNMMKYIKEDRHTDVIPIMERAGEIIRSPIKKKKKKKTEGLTKAILLGELGGLTYQKSKNNDTKRVMKLYEHNSSLNEDNNKSKIKLINLDSRKGTK